MKNQGRVMGRSLSGTPSPYASERFEPAAPRFTQQFFCGAGHVFELTFFIDAEATTQWVCPACGQLAPSVADGPIDNSRPKRWATSDGKSHLDRLHERRTSHELETLLKEALTNYRQTGKAFPSAF